jgi:sugar phosphate isomerase/epimerase
MIDWQVGLSTGCFFDRSIFDCLEPIRNAGFATLEICSHGEHFDYHDQGAVHRTRELMDQFGLEAYSMHAPFRKEIDISSPDEQRRRVSVEEVKRAAQSAAHLGAKYLVIHPGPERDDIDRLERLPRMDHAADSLNQIAHSCRECGVRLVLENMLGHLFTGPVRELLWILGSLDVTDVGLCLDTGHAALTGDLHGILHKIAGHLWMVHASDNRGEFDDHLPPGKGTIDWKMLLEHLAKRDFRGSLILELNGRNAVERVLSDAQNSRRFLRGLIRTLENA